ncbi:GNAT superfamily N-acetyltransferase [Pedobacter sp. UYP24]
MILHKAITKTDIERCRNVIIGLRPELSTENYIEKVWEMIQEGYELHFILDDETDNATCFIGFRTFQMLRTGKMIYIDDLFTLPEYRGKGYAGMLLDHVEQLALKNGASSLHLDSGYSRHDAHRLYLNKGYIMECQHFAKQIINQP